MTTLTREETLKIIQDAQAARRRGDYEEASRISKQLPLAPHLAMFLKEELGPENLITEGYDLSEAEAEYGKDWLIK